ncbi:hypothetical protein CTAYLR_006874 [Chrysophaeum taylorii]|uniref:Uncharacterized protein n=1 Tax=Chrysophaeum taylorii TaxID=2483200 RepID=A0AAD7U566_9STRA|nr:hypothetical protein CTAYLR_006874 [Chrysophaeum taylorii]
MRDVSSSSDDELRGVPAGALGRVGIELLRNARAGEDELARGTCTGSIVDQSQFRNIAVGEGYKAPFVVRQPTAHPKPEIIDERPKKRAKKDKKKKKKKKDKRKKRHRRSQDDDDDDDTDDEQAAEIPVVADDWEFARRLARFEALLEERISRRRGRSPTT